MLAELPASVLREDLLRRSRAASSCPRALLSSLAADSDHARSGGVARPAGAPANGGGPRSTRGREPSATFLVLCVSLPAEGEKLLSSIDPDELLTSEPYRRAARHLTGRVASPLADLPPDDEQLASLSQTWWRASGRAGQVSADQLRHAELVLELGPARARDPARSGVGVGGDRRPGSRARADP